MINPQTKTEQLLFCTTRIETSTGTGTGFFFRFQIDEEKGINVLVTNKHVVANADEIVDFTRSFQPFHKHVSTFSTVNQAVKL